MDPDGRDQITGRFKPGNKCGPGRPKGSRDKTPSEIRQWFFEAADKIGRDNKGKDGGQEFVEGFSREKKEALYNGLLKLVGSAKSDDDEPRRGDRIGTINIISIPHGHMKCPDGKLRPLEEARVLWELANLDRSAQYLIGPPDDPDAA